MWGCEVGFVGWSGQGRRVGGDILCDRGFGSRLLFGGGRGLFPETDETCLFLDGGLGGNVRFGFGLFLEVAFGAEDSASEGRGCALLNGDFDGDWSVFWGWREFRSQKIKFLSRDGGSDNLRIASQRPLWVGRNRFCRMTCSTDTRLATIGSGERRRNLIQYEH